MQWKFRRYIAAGLLLLSFFLIYLVTFGKFTLENVQSLFSIIGSTSILIALISYFERKDRDVTVAAIDLVSFYRKEVIPACEDLLKFADSKSYVRPLPKIKLDEPNLVAVRKNYPSEAASQTKLSQDREMFSKQTAILNMLEELSLKINHFNALDHNSLDSIKAPFVEMVEICAWTLLMQREIYTGLPTYQTTLDIYKKWKDSIDRKSPEDRAKESLR